MKRKEYEHQMRILHGELVAMQEWVKDSGTKICVVFEGRDFFVLVSSWARTVGAWPARPSASQSLIACATV
jgi:polyphosphate kinase 2 PPK2